MSELVDTRVPYPRRIFCNRNLRMDRIRFIGFDMDYTLARYTEPMEHLDDRERCLVQVHVGPPKAQELGAPQPGKERQVNHRIVDGALSGFQEPSNAAIVQGRHFCAPWAGRINGLGHVADHQAPLDGVG